jgi:hypothetical protein
VLLRVEGDLQRSRPPEQVFPAHQGRQEQIGQVLLAPIRISLARHAARSCANGYVRFFATRHDVQDFSDNLRRLRDGHSRAVEEEIAVRKYDVAVFYRSQFLTPRILFQ